MALEDMTSQYGPFNKKGQLTNKKNEIYSLIHQYDRSFYKNGLPVFNYKRFYG